jgi:hypothetical protein
MRPTRFIPLAVLVLAAACSDTATSPTSVGGPLFAVAEGSYPLSGPVTTLNAGGTPSGGHFQANTSALCTVSSTLVITCTTTGDGTYQINGIGNTNANALLSASYTATVDCTNKGGNLVEVKSQLTDASVSSPAIRAKNGSITVPQLSTSTPSDADFFAQATCPNGNWRKSLAGGSAELVSFTYTLTFVGFTTPAISISAGP